MAKTNLQEAADLGQAIWLDYIRRSFLLSGGLKDYVGQGLRGVTSNPSIFSSAIKGSDDYDQDLQQYAKQGLPVEKIYEELAVADIQLAADILKPVFDRTQGADGYISLEVNPHLAHDTNGSLSEAKRLFSRVDRPNVMIKVPATAEGLPAVQALLVAGLNINITLMFSQEQYDQVAEAYLSALEQRLADGKPIDQIASVASIFVSRMDVKLDPLLAGMQTQPALKLQGKIGIANARLIYQHFKQAFSGARWDRLAAKGARVQRVLYGSTSTKNPNYPDTLYADNLIGPQTVNTLPPETLEAFLDHGTVALTLEKDLEAAQASLDELARLGIQLDEITRQLLDEGVEKFAQPFDTLLANIAEKKARLLA
jgi:transaldolase